MLIEVSTGEVIDKYNILEIKRERIDNPDKLIEIQTELDALTSCKVIINKHKTLYKLLGIVNREIWDLTNIIKAMDVMECDKYSNMAKQIFNLNQKRFRIKNHFNLISSSGLKEQKSYSPDICRVIIPDDFNIYTRLPEFNYLFISYDIVIIDCANPTIFDVIKRVFNNPAIVKPESLPGLGVMDIVYLDNYNLDNTDKINYGMEPVTYIAGGLLGDFIQQLSVINEVYLDTGRKGILYIADIGDSFRMGLENAYKDTYALVCRQPYIAEYKIYCGETGIDADLSAWRKSRLLFKTSWYEIFKSVYKVEWGTHPWLTGLDIDTKWTDTVVINTTEHRFTNNIHYREIIAKYGAGNCIYVSFNSTEYDGFKARTGITEITRYTPGSLMELAIIINSCKLFIGSLSAPLSIAHAIYKPRIMGLFANSGGCINHVTGLDKILPGMTVI
jgi:hypothetical protein